MLKNNGICINGRIARKALRVCETTPLVVCKQISHLRDERRYGETPIQQFSMSVYATLEEFIYLNNCRVFL
jgi:hypothetical protein